MEIIIDRKGPIGLDGVSFDECHFASPENLKLCDAIDFILSTYVTDRGQLRVCENYDPDRCKLGKTVVVFEYERGEVLWAHSLSRVIGDYLVKGEDIELLMDRNVALILKRRDWSTCIYFMYFVE